MKLYEVNFITVNMWFKIDYIFKSETKFQNLLKDFEINTSFYETLHPHCVRSDTFEPRQCVNSTLGLMYFWFALGGRVCVGKA